MSLRLRNGIWQADLRIHGRRIQRSTGTADRRLAQEYHDRFAGELWRMRRLGERPRRTWSGACLRWLRETEAKRDHGRDVARLATLEPYIGDPPLEDVDRDAIDDAADALTADRDLAAGGINRYLALIRAILRRAEREWRWLEAAPAVRLRAEPPGRVRWLTRAEYTRLMRAAPDWLRGPLELGIQTGLRQSNLFALRWERVDLGRRVAWIPEADHKNGRALRVPLNDAAIAVLRAQRGVHPERVFDRDGAPVRLDGRTWRELLERAGIEDLRFHDATRHTWASWHVMAGTGLQELMALAGWSSYDMALRYAHLAPGYLDTAAEGLTPPGDAGPVAVPEPSSRSQSS